jgi:hypothetical protein
LTTDKDSILVGVNGWQPEFPEVRAGEYLWTKTIYYYTNNTQTITYGVSRQGEDGKQGPAGASAASFRLSCNQTEILKFIDKSTSETIVSPSSLIVTVLKDEPSTSEGTVQITDLNLVDFNVEVYNLNTGEWHPVFDSEIITLSPTHTFNVNLQRLIEKGYEEGNLAGNQILSNECIIKVSYTLYQENESGEEERFNLTEFLNVRYGMNKDMASLSVKAEGIVAAMQDSKMVFNASGLTI